jgi:hypothetical protein
MRVIATRGGRFEKRAEPDARARRSSNIPATTIQAGDSVLLFFFFFFL